MAKNESRTGPEGGGLLRLVERDIPEPGGPGRCGSRSRGLRRVPWRRGHEVRGSIPSSSRACRGTRSRAESTRWARTSPLGKRVSGSASSWHGGHCFVCSYCRKGPLLELREAEDHGRHYDGGYADYVVVPG